MPPESFLSLVNRLTQPHPVAIVVDGELIFPTARALLHRLRVAVFADMSEGGGGGGFGSKPPIDPAALDLIEEITTQASEALHALTGKPTPYGHVEDYVREWAAGVDSEKRVIVTTAATSETEEVYRMRHEFTAQTLATHWVRRISDFFDPPKVRPIQAPCPDCGARFVARYKDGELVQADALSIYFVGERVDAARCAVCAAEWWPGAFLDVLAPLVGAAPIPELTPRVDKG